MKRPSEPLPPLVATHPQHRALDEAPPGRRRLSFTLGKEYVATLRSKLKAMAEAGAASASGEGSASESEIDVRDRARNGGARGSSSGSDSDGSSGGGSASASSGSDGEAGAARSAEVAVVVRPDGADAEGAAAAGAGRPGLSTRHVRSYEAALEAHRLAYPPAVLADPGKLFAVVTIKGAQYKVTEGDVINTEYMPEAAVSALLAVPAHIIGARERTVIGRPTVPGAGVRLAVEEHAQDVKVIVYKKKRRKRYQRTKGHRRLVTRLRVVGIDANLSAY